MELQVKDVEYSYKTKYQVVNVLHGVNGEFETGKMYAIVGASGSGKSTLLSLMAGLDIPKNGEISWDGITTKERNLDEYRANDVAVIYQGFNLFHHLTVLENAAYPLYLRKVNRKEADEVAKMQLKNVGLTEDQMNRLPNMLSGGEQQRVAIARALVAGSKLILADEPTGNLDKKNSENIIEILSKLAHEEGCCIIVVTHDMAVSDSADETWVISDGVMEKQ